MNALAYALRQELPADEAARDGLFGGLLRSQFCFSETCGFTFGVDPEASFAILQNTTNRNRLAAATAPWTADMC